jgi:hypothetical protein
MTANDFRIGENDFNDLNAMIKEEPAPVEAATQAQSSGYIDRLRGRGRVVVRFIVEDMAEPTAQVARRIAPWRM